RTGDAADIASERRTTEEAASAHRERAVDSTVPAESAGDRGETTDCRATGDLEDRSAAADVHRTGEIQSARVHGNDRRCPRQVQHANCNGTCATLGKAGSADGR